MTTTSRPLLVTTSHPPARVSAFVGVQIFSSASGLLLQVVAAHMLGARGYGTFVVANSFGLALAVIAGSGVPKVLWRFVGIDRRCLSGAWQSMWRAHLPICALMGLALATSATFLGVVMKDARLPLAIQLTAVEFLFKAALLEPIGQLLNGAGRPGAHAWLMAAYASLRSACPCVALWASPTTAAAILGLVLAAAAGAAVAVMLLLQLIQLQSDEDIEIDIRSQLMRWEFLLPGVDALIYLVAISNLWFLKASTPPPGLFAAYAACHGAAAGILPFGSAMSRGIFAALAMAIASGNLNLAVNALKRTTTILCAGGVFLAIVAFTSGDRIISYAYGIPAFGVNRTWCQMCGGMLGLALCWHFAEALVAIGWFRARVATLAGSALASLAISYILPRAEGCAGAALALLLSGVAGAMITGVVLSYGIGAFTPWHELTRLFAIAAAVSWIFGRYSHGNSLTSLAMDLAGVALLYAGAIVFGKRLAAKRRHYV